MLAVFAKRSPSSDSRSETSRPDDVREHREGELETEKGEERAQVPAREPAREIRRRSRQGQVGESQDLVDDPLADEERRDRQQRAQEPQEERRQREARVDLPDQAEKRPQIPERREALPQRPRRPAIDRPPGRPGAARRAAAPLVLPGCTASPSPDHLTSAAAAPSRNEKGAAPMERPLQEKIAARSAAIRSTTLLQRSVPMPKLLGEDQVDARGRQRRSSPSRRRARCWRPGSRRSRRRARRRRSRWRRRDRRRSSPGRRRESHPGR